MLIAFGHKSKAKRGFAVRGKLGLLIPLYELTLGMAFTCLLNCQVQLPEQVIQVLSLNPGLKPESSGQRFGTLPDTAMAAIPIFGKNITLVLLVK